VLCDVLEVRRSGYHQRRQRTAHDKPHRSRVSNNALLARVKAIHTQVKGEYGWPRARRAAMDELIDWAGLYNARRLHSALDYVSSMTFEKNWFTAQRGEAA
jgi:phage gp16-like protein